MVTLLTPTPPEWVDIVLSNFDSFLIDHAACERKASAVGLSFVVRYPDRQLLIDPMIQFAREELEHFHQVYRILEARGLTLGADYEDEYVNILMRQVRSGRDERFLDRLLVSSVIEARGHERLTLVAQALTDPTLAAFYERLARAENHHRTLFAEIALSFFSQEEVSTRLCEWLRAESTAIASVPLRPAVH